VVAEDHLLVEPVDRKEVVAQDELEITRRVETDPLAAQGRLIQS